LESRLKGITIFGEKSLKLVAMRVAQYSGDIRRSLQITKRAVEICRESWLQKCEKAAEKNGTKPDEEARNIKLDPVTMTNAMSAFDELQKSKVVKVLKGLRRLEVLLVVALWLELKGRK